MGIVNSGSFAKALWPGVNAWYGKAYSEYPTEWDKLFTKHTSKKAYEEDVGTSGFGLASVKSEGNSIAYDEERQGFTTRYTHVTYGMGFIVTREAFDDDQYDVVGQRKAQGLAYSIRQTKEVLGANVYNRAFNSTYTGGDGKELCATDHPNVAGGTWSNELTTAADLSEAALEQAVIDIANFTNDRGLRIAVRPQKLVIPVNLMFEAQRILKSTGRVAT
jgi:phage major head subunit gpT-like protein